MELLLYNEAKLEVAILGWVGSAIFPEGRRCIRDGILDCFQSQGVMSCCRTCQRAMTKVPMNLFHWDLAKELRKTLWLMPMDPRYLVNRCHGQA
jgi:hypothetical protein